MYVADNDQTLLKLIAVLLSLLLLKLSSLVQ
jgi:hypothetical protein